MASGTAPENYTDYVSEFNPNMEVIMGYAIVKGRYHKGPKKNTRKRRFNKPTFDTPTDEKVKVVPTAKPTVVVAKPTITTSVVSDDRRPSGHGGGMGGFIGLLDGLDLSGFGGRRPSAQPTAQPTVSKPTAQSTAQPTADTKGEVIVGYIVRKPNGDLVLKFK